MLNTHIVNLVRSYIPTIEQLTRCYAFIVPFEDNDKMFGIDIELTDGSGEREVYTLDVREDGLSISTNADLVSNRLKIMTDILDSIQEKIESSVFSRMDYFERNGLKPAMDEEGWKKVENLIFTTEKESDKPRIYFDMDGTLAVFNKNATMEEVFTPGYFRSLNPIPEMVAFAKELQHAGYDVNILSGACYTAIQEKIEWLQEHMPFITPDKYTFVPVDADKSQFIPNAEHSVLIDDYNKNLDEWKGLAVKCKTDINSYNPKYASVVVGAYNNINRLEAAIDKWNPKERLTLSDYLTLTHSEDDQKRPMIVCNDGFKLFVGAGHGYYSEPESNLMNGSTYTSVQVMYPSSEDKRLSDFAGEYLLLSDSIVNSSIPYVPLSLLEEVITSHKGISAEKTFTPYDIARFEIKDRWIKGGVDHMLSKNGSEALEYLADHKENIDYYGLTNAVKYVLDSIGEDVPGFIAQQASEGIAEMELLWENEGYGDYTRAAKCMENVLDFARQEHSAATAYLCEVCEESWQKSAALYEKNKEMER